MEDIIEPTMDYDFAKLYFGPPSTLAGGAYFTRLMYNTNKPLFIQTPKSLTKQGFVKSGKKIYTDLLFDNNDTIFINWVENLETRCQELIYTKRESWFESKLEKDDIESAFTSPFKIFKSGKYYVLRVNVKPNIKIYDEKDQIIPSESITNDKHLISILEIQGLKFTSRNFQIEFELKQSMVVSPDPFLDECFIKKPTKKQQQQPIDVLINDNNNDNNNDNENENTIDLDNLINKSAQDLAKKNTDQQINLSDTFDKLDNKGSIDLGVSFDEKDDKDKRGDVINKSENENKNNYHHLFDLEEAHIDLSSLNDTDITKNENENKPNEESDEDEDEDPNVLKEVDLSSTLDNNLETMQLKKPNQVFYEIYQKAREKAKEAKKNAILAYLEMKNIKKTYMLDDIDESDNEFDEFASRDSSSEISDAESLEDNY